MLDFSYITETAKKPANTWTNKQKATFHTFNEFGVVSRFRRLSDTLADMVDEGEVKSGALLAYSYTFNASHADELYSMSRSKRVNTNELIVLIYMIKNQIASLDAFITRTREGV